jgi:oligoribonuclease
MTGLDRQQDTVMSLCCIVTDSDLQPLDSFGFDRVVHHSEAQLANMSAWCLDVHGKSGLTRACLKSTTSAEVVAKDLLEYIQKLVPTPHTGVLAGNCVHCDRDFLSKGPYKKVVDYLHYSIFDVKSLTTAATMWTSGELEGKPERKGLHQARADILEAIEMAKFYRSVFFANKRSPKLTSEP